MGDYERTATFRLVTEGTCPYCARRSRKADPAQTIDLVLPQTNDDRVVTIADVFGQNFIQGRRNYRCEGENCNHNDENGGDGPTHDYVYKAEGFQQDSYVTIKLQRFRDYHEILAGLPKERRNPITGIGGVDGQNIRWNGVSFDRDATRINLELQSFSVYD